MKKDSPDATTSGQCRSLKSLKDGGLGPKWREGGNGCKPERGFKMTIKRAFETSGGGYLSRKFVLKKR